MNAGNASRYPAVSVNVSCASCTSQLALFGKRVVSVVAHRCFQVFARLCVWPTKAYACAKLLLPQFGKFLHEAFGCFCSHPGRNAQATAHRHFVAGSTTPQRVRNSRRDAGDASSRGVALWTPRVCLLMSAGKPSSCKTR